MCSYHSHFYTCLAHYYATTVPATLIPANFFWDINVRFLSWECWDFWRRHDHFRRFPKNSKVFRRSPKTSEDVRSLPKAKLSSPSLRTRINASSLPLLFTSKIRDREEGVVIYSFYTWFSFLTWVWVSIFLEIMSSKMATTHIFQSGVRNWPASVSRREIEVFNPQVWDSRLRRESWPVYTLATATATDFTTTPPPLQCVYIYKYFIPVPRLYLLSFCLIISGHSLMVNLSRILKSLAVEHSVAVVVSMTVC